MSRRFALLLLTVGALLLLVVGWRAVADLPAVGSVPHPYGARAVGAAFSHHTANVVASLTMDQRAFDTLGEELLLFSSAVAAVLLLRRMHEEDEQSTGLHASGTGDVFESLRLVGYLLLPVTLVVGCYVVVHGHVSPGGGFQGGVVLATGLHLAYLAGDVETLDRIRDRAVFDVSEALGAAAYLVVGLSGFAAGAALLSNWLPTGKLGDLLSGGTVPLLNVVVGIEVGSAFVLLLAKFLEQALVVRDPGEEGSENATGDRLGDTAAEGPGRG